MRMCDDNRPVEQAPKVRKKKTHLRTYDFLRSTSLRRATKNPHFPSTRASPSPVESHGYAISDVTCDRHAFARAHLSHVSTDSACVCACCVVCVLLLFARGGVEHRRARRGKGGRSGMEERTIMSVAHRRLRRFEQSSPATENNE